MAEAPWISKLLDEDERGDKAAKHELGSILQQDAPPPGAERTALSPKDEAAFQAWTKANKIRDVDHPDSHYDYRGAYKAGVQAGPDAHWPDTYKQHGHPTFSEESQYSRGRNDGGHWDWADQYVPSSGAPIRREDDFAKAIRDAMGRGQELPAPRDPRIAANSPLAAGVNLFAPEQPGARPAPAPMARDAGPAQGDIAAQMRALGAGGMPRINAPAPSVAPINQSIPDQLAQASGGAPRGMPQINAAIPQQQVDLRGVAPRGPMPMVDLSGGPGARLTPAQMDRHGMADSNVDLSQMHAAGDVRDPNSLAFAAPAAGQAAPAPMQTVNVAAQNQALVDPKTQAELDAKFRDQERAVGGQQEAARGSGIAEALQANVQGEGQKTLAGAQRGEAGRMADAAKARQDQHLSNIAALHKMNDDLAKQQEDPDRYWKSLGLGTKIRYGAANIVGGFLKGFQHRDRNDAADQLAGLVQQDIAAQRTNFERQKGKVANATNLYERAYQITGDADQAMRLAMSVGLDAVKNETMGAATQVGGDVARAKAEETAARLEERKAQIGREAVEAKIKENHYIPAHQVQVGGGPGGIVSDVKPDEVIRLPEGKYVTVPKEDRAKVLGHIHTAEEVRATLPRLKALSEVPIFQRGPGWQKEVAEAAKVFTAPEIQEGGKGGIGVFKVFQDPVSPTMKIFTPGMVAAAEDIAKRQEAKAQASLGASAGHYVEPTYRLNPKTGEQERRYVITGEYKSMAKAPAGAPPGFKPVAP